MNKKAVVITINAKVCKWVCQKIQEEKKSVKALNDLEEGFQGLKDSEYDSLIISINNIDNGLDEIQDKTQQNNIIVCEKLYINGDSRSVYYDGELIQLTPKEFDILYLLAKNRGKIYSKEHIYNQVWKDNYSFDDNNIMAHIGKLRKKIEPNPAKPVFIITVWGVGYKFNSNLV